MQDLALAQLDSLNERAYCLAALVQHRVLLWQGFSKVEGVKKTSQSNRMKLTQNSFIQERLVMDYPTLFSEIQESSAQTSKRAPALYEVCQRLVDGRRARGKRYDLAGLVVILVLAKLAGMQRLLGASQWVQDQQAFLRARLRLSWKHMPCEYLQLCLSPPG